MGHVGQGGFFINHLFVVEIDQVLVHGDHSLVGAGLNHGFNLGDLVFPNEVGDRRRIKEDLAGRDAAAARFWNQLLREDTQ